MYYIKYNKVSGAMVDIISTSFNDDAFTTKQITKEEKEEVLLKLNSGKLIFVINNIIVYKINEVKKREAIVDYRNKELEIFDKWIRPRFHTKKGLVTEDIEAEMDLYYDRLLDLPNDYDLSDNKELYDIDAFLQKPSFITEQVQ